MAGAGDAAGVVVGVGVGVGVSGVAGADGVVCGVGGGGAARWSWLGWWHGGCWHGCLRRHGGRGVSWQSRGVSLHPVDEVGDLGVR